MINWAKYGIEVSTSRTSGQIKIFCPQCRDKRSNKRDRSLSCDLATGLFHCHYCGFSGNATEHKRDDYTPIRHQKPSYRKPTKIGSETLSEKVVGYFSGRGIGLNTLTRMKITEGMEYMPQKGKEVNTIQFNYYKDGELVNTKYRTGDKCFKLVSGAELLPYNIDSIKGKCECVVTEGEIDALSFIECGVVAVVSVPNGANANLSYLDDYIESHFEDKETIYIASDSDTKGVELRNELIRRFGAERCKIVDYGPECKDANEHLIKYGKESLLKCLEDAPEPQLEGIFTVSNFETALDALFENGMQKGLVIGHDNFDKLCSFETKRLCIVTGIPGCLDENTLVEMADGTRKPISQIEVGDKVITLQRDYTTSVRSVTNKWDSGIKECYEIVTRDGHRVLATDEHRFLTFDGWKKLAQIKVGEFIGVNTNATQNNLMNTDILKLAAIWLAEGNKNTSSYVITNATQEIISELGNICKRNNLTLSNNTKNEYIVGEKKPLNVEKKRYISSISYWLRKNKNLTNYDSLKVAEERYEERVEQGVSLFSPKAELKKLGCWGVKSDELRVPDTIMQLANEQIGVFLNFLFGCDGSFYKGRVEYCSISHRLCEDIQVLLSRFAINSTLRKKKVRYKGEYRIAYTLTVEGYMNLSLFVNNIGIIGKQEQMQKYLETPIQDNKTDYIPATIKKELIYGDKFYKKHLGINMSMNDHTKKRVNRQMVVECAKLQPNGLAIIEKLNNDCRWREIKSITPVGKKHTYDIEVEDTHNFIANGIITHNSGKSEFIDEIAERLNIRYQWRFAYFSPENAPLSYHASKLIEKFTGVKFDKQHLDYMAYQQVKQHLEQNFFFLAPKDDFRLDTILERAKFLVRRKGIKALVIDPYNRLEDHQTFGRNETQHVSAILDRLTNFAQQNDLLVILMAHPVKLAKNKEGIIEAPTLYDISGSANFYNKADFGIVVHRDRVNNIVEVHVQKVKFRHLGEVGIALFKYNLNNGRYVPYEENFPPCWDNINHLNESLNRMAEMDNIFGNSDFENEDNDFPF